MMVSICIPVYEMHGRGTKFLARNLHFIAMQSFTDYEVIVSDHSKTGENEEVCSWFPKVRYVRNPADRGNPSANLNNAIKSASGEYIKIILQDDFLLDGHSLGKMCAAVEGNFWLAHGYWHTNIMGRERVRQHTPRLHTFSRECIPVNYIGAPTAIIFKACDLLFDQTLAWLMDLDFYYRMFLAFGEPCILPEPLAVVTNWKGQLTYALSGKIKRREEEYILATYGHAFDSTGADSISI